MHVLISLILFVLVAGIAWWCIKTLMSAFGLPQPIQAVVIVIFVLICLAALVDYLGVYNFNLH